MALFGAPTAHEDDPERAVRAALAIRDFALEEELELRVGITTGEALVRLDAHTRGGRGHGLRRRRQHRCPPAVRRARQRRHRRRDDVPRDPRARSTTRASSRSRRRGSPSRSRFGRPSQRTPRFGVDVAHEARSELVGRERELGSRARRLRACASRTDVPSSSRSSACPASARAGSSTSSSASSTPTPELITWRQGRCLAYGDGVTLWALGEIVKAQAGVLEQDPPSEVVGEDPPGRRRTRCRSRDAAWVESHLLALVGLAGEAELGGDRRNEAFSAWRRFLEGLAEQRPLVLVVRGPPLGRREPARLRRRARRLGD